ncbi:hypothetical protein BOX15_Mlig025175g2, partial [Macrostomum lignano]
TNYSHNLLTQSTHTIYSHNLLTQSTHTIYSHNLLTQSTHTIYSHNLLSAMNFSLLVAAALVAALTGPSLNLAEELPRDKREDHSVCLSGHQLSNDSDFICEPCSAGTYREIAVSSKCQKCPKGSYSRAGAAACSKCWPGSFAASSGSANCQKCAKGSMASTDGLSSCTPCPAGSFISFSGSPACVQCPAGTWSKAGAAKCSKCQPGHVSPAGAAACTSCPAGKFSSRSGSIECTPCPAGSFSAAGASACTRCPAGQFSEEGSKQCKACPPGTFSDAEGAAECQQCDRNFALAIRSGMTKCDLCPGGGASFGENRCYKKVKVSCRESTPNCERTIDNDVHSYGQALHKLHSKPTDPESGTHFVYKFGTSINLRGVIVWGKYGCCREGSRILQVVVMPNNAKVCRFDKKYLPGKYYAVQDQCKYNSVKDIKINHRYSDAANKIITVAEAAFYAY